VRVLVPSGNQMEPDKFVQTSTTTAMFVAQEMMKLNPLVCTPKSELWFRISGFGSTHGAVGRSSNVTPQPVVPGR